MCYGGIEWEERGSDKSASLCERGLCIRLDAITYELGLRDTYSPEHDPRHAPLERRHMEIETFSTDWDKEIGIELSSGSWDFGCQQSRGPSPTRAEQGR